MCVSLISNGLGSPCGIGNYGTYIRLNFSSCVPSSYNENVEKNCDASEKRDERNMKMSQYCRFGMTKSAGKPRKCLTL